MYFRQFLNDHHGCASYLVASRQSGEAAVVDPALDIAQYEEVLTERGYTLKYVIDTHIHADHISGARELARKHNAELVLYATANDTYPFRPVQDGEELALGQLRLRVMHTPGHRPELMSILVINPERTAEPSMVLTGDSLLVGDAGRPDFGGGDAAAQYDSLQKLLALPDWVAVFPGHFEGPCGKGMCGRPSTTIGFEKRFNPLTTLNRDAFLRELSEVPARPLNMNSIEATNRGTADLFWAMPDGEQDVPEIDIETVIQQLRSAAPPVLIDVREPHEFAESHVPGAINLPQAELAQRLAELPKEELVLVVCEAGSRSLKAAKFLKQQGFTAPASVQGGTAAWRAARETATI
jgi:glyoxylase-like metal-dependent hydrolase (beta-lactamase superfamily II)/rhodanese-related sulfurtransferase